jgi:site-specific recombinase XerD
MNMKIKEAFEGYLDHRKRLGMDPKTIASDKLILYGSFSHSISERELDSLKMSDIADVVVAGRAHGEYGPQRSVTALRKFFKYLEDSGIQPPFDWRDIDVPHVPKKINEYLTKEELMRILDSFDLKKLHGLRTRALCEVLFATGMRISEALSLNKNDIDWATKEALVINAKNGDQQSVLFTDRALLWLRRYLQARNDDLPYLFAAGKVRLLDITARTYLRTHTLHLGINKHIKNHIFRKSFATHLIQQGADPATVSQLCRHRDVRTTLRYYAAINKERSKEVHSDIMNATLKKVDDEKEPEIKR